MSSADYDEAYKLWSNSKGVGLRALDDSMAGIDKFLKRNPLTNFVALEDNRIIGIILCGNDGRRGYIYHAAVKETHRRKGIGKAMVNSVLEALKKEAINKVALIALTSNQIGNNFWQSIGFDKRDDIVYRDIIINDKNI
ncbi:MAG: GNAT family N-acetyltransferase [Syntrophomonas sp.]|nr:GNAT family N-acetyltransferase [Syntrophomonas sp.]